MHWIAKGVIGLAKATLGIDRADATTIARRNTLCSECPKLIRTAGVLRRCGVCGCIIVAKIRLASQSCSDKPPSWVPAPSQAAGKSPIP